MYRARKRNICPVNVAWLLIERGELRVDFDTSEVYRWLPRLKLWKRIAFRETTPTEHHTGNHAGGYFSAKLQITVDGAMYRQHCFLHRIVWQAKYREELRPEDQVDHGAAGKSCNLIWNLERVTPAENARRRSQANAAVACAEDDF